MEIKDYEDRIAQLVMQGNFTELQVLINEIGSAIIAMDSEAVELRGRLEELGDKSGRLGTLRNKTQQLLLQVNTAITNFQAPPSASVVIPVPEPIAVPAVPSVPVPAPEPLPVFVPMAPPVEVPSVPVYVPEPIAQIPVAPSPTVPSLNIDDLLDNMGDDPVPSAPSTPAAPPAVQIAGGGHDISIDDILNDISEDAVDATKSDEGDLEKMLKDLNF
jgi:hypothetical protein